MILRSKSSILSSMNINIKDTFSAQGRTIVRWFHGKEIINPSKKRTKDFRLKDIGHKNWLLSSNFPSGDLTFLALKEIAGLHSGALV